MICAFPIESTYGHRHPCGQCMPCRINTRRKRVARILMEGRLHKQNSWLTLTYDDEHLPWADCDGMLMPVLRVSDWQKWIKRYRKDAGRPGIRYFGVGEYGDQYGRPHWHAVMFGEDAVDCEARMRRTWTAGKVLHCRPLEEFAAHYASGYCVKKWTKHGDERLAGRPAERSFSSRSPALGERFVREYVAPALFKRSGAAAIPEGS